MADIGKESLANSADPKSIQDLTTFVMMNIPLEIDHVAETLEAVQNLLQQMQDKFQTMSDQIITRIDDMGSRIDDLEKNIADLMTQAGVDDGRV